MAPGPASCSKKALIFVVLPLLPVLLPEPTSAARLASGGSQERCSKVKSCDEKSCGGICAVLGINGVGTCKTVAGAPSCCCVPKSSSAAVSFLPQQLGVAGIQAPYCHVAPKFEEKWCGAQCAVNMVNCVGKCTTVGGVPNCCCVPPKSSASSAVATSSFLVFPPLATAAGNQEKCGRVNSCDEKSCGAQCAFHEYAGVGTCRTIAGALNCCCVQKS